jgi:hypothetical protein
MTLGMEEDGGGWRRGEQTNRFKSIVCDKTQGSGQRIVHFSSVMAMESTMDEVSARKKKIQGFPPVFHI